MVADLRALLRAAGLPDPYVLVGNSLGGMNARLYACQHPEELAGLVLVDGSHHDQFTRIGEALPAHTWDYWDLHVQEALAQHAEVLGITAVTD